MEGCQPRKPSLGKHVEEGTSSETELPMEQEEGGASSKQGKRKRVPSDQQDSSDSDSCISFKSDHSMEPPWNLLKFSSSKTGVLPKKVQKMENVPKSSVIPEEVNQQGLEESLEIGQENIQAIKDAQQNLKSCLKKTFQHIFEGIAKQGNPSSLKDIYTELYITEGGKEELMNEEGISQYETKINCNDLFKPLYGQEKHFRTVISIGIAGIGKTVSVQKFILDWAEGEANQDVHFMFPLKFRDLNLEKGNEYSLIELLHHYFPDLSETADNQLSRLKVVLILDGLDECRLPLDFQNNEICCDVTKRTSLDVLLTNLIKGNLLHSANLWITSRLAASSQIPPECVHRVTEIRGFEEPQKELYFRRRLRDENLANSIIRHIKKSRNLYTMCHIPVFCWISATVLEHMLAYKDCTEIPTTLTEMYIHFLLIQMHRKSKKYDGTNETNRVKLLQSNKEMILKLAELAFKQLGEGHLVFYAEDFKDCGVDVIEASGYSGMCTEFFREEDVVLLMKVYSFVHLSVQEFMAALYVFHVYRHSNRNLLEKCGAVTSKAGPLTDLLKSAIDRALESESGHLDLFLRFLLGISLDSNQRLLQGLLTGTESSSLNANVTVEYIEGKIKNADSPKMFINLFYCLNELQDNSIVYKVQNYLSSGSISREKLSSVYWSALVFVLLTSEEVEDEFDLKKYVRSEHALLRLLPVAKLSRVALLNQCRLTVSCCEALASVLALKSSHWTHLDLSYNDLQDSGLQLLAAGLMNRDCKLKILRLEQCSLTEECCEILASVLNSSHLREVDLSCNAIKDSGVKQLCTALGGPLCKLETLSLRQSTLTDTCCEALATALSSNPSQLRNLDLSDNDLGDSGVRLLTDGLKSLHCKLEILRLAGCHVTQEGCATLASSLCSCHSQLRELDLSYNHLGDSTALQDPNCKLEKLNVNHSGECRLRPGLLKYACTLTLDPDTAHRCLILSEGNRKVTHERGDRRADTDQPTIQRFTQVLCREKLNSRCYWEVEWDGEGAWIGMAYKGTTSRQEDDTWIGFNATSWSLSCSGKSYTVWHDSSAAVSVPQPPSSRVGVYLDWEAGTLSFYSVTSEKRTHLYKFTTKFTEPLYPGFWVLWGSTVSLCQL
ncbi:NLR family CARD domain-containing protein 3-like isoform X2 [Paramormyrops kingsleyae]|uniref:NLR family CARD domain-containing protein 3-like isoform X2 n=1 Tax=Paramormyrops kingsleyae TaxID=1676925 RepID=UPI000CD62566|nr:NACHT, LRR and PYD domains-containing protein 3-like isoform X2 [Paramormyrops kingsleyae]